MSLLAVIEDREHRQIQGGRVGSKEPPPLVLSEQYKKWVWFSVFNEI